MQQRFNRSLDRRARPSPEGVPTRDAPSAAGRLRQLVFAIVAVLALAVGVALAVADLTGPRGAPSAPEAITVRISMAGFDPPVISARAGERVTIELWTTDSAIHLEGGVHTFISDELGLREELPAESRRTFSFTAPDRPGDYDFYCDTCCGGRASPTMHGVLRVSA